MSTSSFQPDTNLRNCLSEEELDAFVEQTLDDVELHLATEHISKCGQCEQRWLKRFTEFKSLQDAVADVQMDDTEATALAELAEHAKRAVIAWPDESLSEADEIPPEQVGRYAVTGLLGTGSFGRVYLAWDPLIDRNVALKVPRLERLTKENSVKQFIQEARSAGRLNHPGIVSVYDANRLDDPENPFACYVAMEYVQGVTLNKSVKHVTPSFVQTAVVIKLIAEALVHAHGRNVVHRDLKPSNILLTLGGNPKILDFGLSFVPTDEQSFARDSYAGTPGYMSPEQVRGQYRLIDSRTDIWSLGVILYRMLTGARPFTGNKMALRHAVLHLDPKRPSEHEPNVPAELERICMRCLCKSTSHRYATAQALVDDLDHWLRGDSSASTDPVVEPRGLSSFTANDAAAYTSLVPGDRDRHGMPLSLLHWKEMVEDPEVSARYPIKVLFGPCGAGKSSYIRAGLLPHLPSHFHKFTLTAGSRDPAEVFRDRLTATWPDLAGDNLEDMIRELRDRLQESGQRALLVVDQFEQLFENEASLEFIEAIRQFDGCYVQAIFVIRDEFWRSTTQFFLDLELPLETGKNCHTLDMLPEDHARQVLETFGRSSGKLPPIGTELTEDQRQFLTLLVEEMRENEQVIPVRLAWLVEIFKSSEWSTAAFRAKGGISGSVATLIAGEFTKHGDTPWAQREVTVAQGILSSLVSPLTGIKSAAKPSAELLSACETDDPSLFRRVLQVLEKDLRVVVPVDWKENGTRGDQRYQLAHDFLVKGIIDWSEQTQRDDPAAQARARLHQLSSAWIQNPTNSRFLPKWSEFRQIASLVPRERMSHSESDWWRAAQRRFFARTVTIALAVALAVTSAFWFSRRMSSQRLLDQLLHASIKNTAPLMHRLERAPRSFNKLLEREWDSLAQAEPHLREQYRLRLSMASLTNHPERERFVVNAISNTDPDDLPALAIALGQCSTDCREQLWNEVEAQKGLVSLKYAACLASIEPSSPHWSAHTEALVEALLHARTSDLEQWVKNLKPIKDVLRPDFVATLGNENHDAIERINQAELFLGFYGREPLPMAAAIEHSHPDQLPIYLRRMSSVEPPFQDELRHRFNNASRLTSMAKPVGSMTLPAPLQAELEEFGGGAGPEGAYVDRLPESAIPKLLERMAAENYLPTCLRVYLDGDEALAVVAWQKSRSGSYKVLTSASATELREFADSLRDQKLMPYDVSYHLRNGKSNFSCVARELDELSETELMLDSTPEEYQRESQTRFRKGQALLRHFIRPDEKRIHLITALWKKNFCENESTGDCQVRVRSIGAINPLNFGYARFDCQLHELPLHQRDNYVSLKHATIGLNRPDLGPELKVSREALAHIMLGQYSNAIEKIKQHLDDGGKDNSHLQITRAKAWIELADFESAEAALSKCESALGSSYDPLRLLIAIRQEDAEEIRNRLAAIESSYKANPSESTRYVLLKAFCWLADIDRTYLTKALELSKHQFPDRGMRLLRDPDFDVLRSDLQFRNKLRAMKLGHRVCDVSVPCLNLDTRWLYKLKENEHYERSASMLDKGWYPNAIARAISEDHGVEVMSVWHRKISPAAVRESSSQATANLATALCHLGDGKPIQRIANGEFDTQAHSYLLSTVGHCENAEAALTSLLAEDVPSDIAYRVLLLLSEISPSDATVEMVMCLRDTSSNRSINSAAYACLSAWSKDVTPTDLAALTNGTLQTNSIGQAFASIHPPTSAVLGTPTWQRDQENSEIPYEADFIRPYAIALTETTVEQFEQFLNSKHGQEDRREFFPRRYAPEPGCPQIGVSYFDAICFCQWLSEKEKLPKDQWCYPGIWSADPGKYRYPKNILERTGYRLLTEAEWEFAARGGSRDARHFGSANGLLGRFAWYASNSGNRTHRVATKLPNSFGVFDMLGNAREFVHGAYEEQLFREIEQERKITAEHTLRGGDFQGIAYDIRSARRIGTKSSPQKKSNGFRVARTLPQN